MNEHEQELTMLEEMEPSELALFLVSQDLMMARVEFTKLNTLMQNTHIEEERYIAMGKRYLKYYNEDNLEEDWIVAEQYMALAKSTRELRVDMRNRLNDITDRVRRYKKQWEQLNKMEQVKQKLMQEQPKN